MDVIDIVKDYLIKNKYEGLGYDNCSCDISDLAPCCHINENCFAGYKTQCDCGEGCDFHISPIKEHKQ